jgi:hypothetical protein
MLRRGISLILTNSIEREDSINEHLRNILVTGECYYNAPEMAIILCFIIISWVILKFFKF